MVDYLPEIIDLVKNLFNIKGNMGIELHPRDINETLLEKLKKYGFNMISIGIQSFQDKCISFLEREKIDSIDKLRLVKKFKFTLVDVDLIFGMPGQTKKDLTDDFIIAVENGATQISTYPFIEFSYASIKNKPLNQKLKKQMLESLLDISEKTGYQRSSIWTFSKDNSPRYSSVTRDNFIGFGPSAATLLKNIFKINTFSVKEYIKCLNNNKLPTALSLKFSPRTRALYWLFWSSYNLNINRDNFYELFSKKLNDIFRFELYWAKKIKYIEKYNSGYKLTGKGAYLFHLIEQAYTRQYIDKTWRTALNNPWPKRIILY
jgi:oxygen-independent coproporphyrinogen-3 oxidase